VQTSPIWYRKAREPDVPEVDRILLHYLKQIAPNFDSTYKYTVNYTVGNTALSVKESFFTEGNIEMFKRCGGLYPWQK